MSFAPALYVITDRAVMGSDPVAAVAAAVAAGASAVELRERDLGARELYELACRMVAVCQRTGAKLLVNDRADIAAAAGASGVHLRADSMPPSEVRRAFPRLLVGASVHSVAEARAAAEADFLLLGPIDDTPSKRVYGPPLGLATLSDVARAVATPVVAVGGVTPASVQALVAAGASGVAAIRAVWERPGEAVRAFLEALAAAGLRTA